MEVLKGENLQQLNIEGHTLIQTVVSLTELPETLAHQEMSEVLLRSGHPSESLTLDQLRSAMLEYLEAIHVDMISTSDTLEKTESHAESNDDAPNAKSLVILE